MKSLLLTLFGITLFQVALAGTVSIQVEGDGYLRFISDGKMVYAKSADLKTINGRLGSTTGAMLVPAIVIADTSNLSVDLEGNVKSSGKIVGRIVLALFESELAPFNTNGFATAASRPTLGNPGEGANGVIRSNAKPQRTTVKVIPQGETAPEATSERIIVQPKVRASLATDIAAKPKLSVDSSLIQVKILDQIEVESDTITLGEISTITAPKSILDKLARIELGDTPLLVVERILDRGRILARIKMAGIDPETVSLIGPDKVRVSRKGQRIGHAQFVESAIRGAQVKGYNTKLESSTPGPEMKVPIGEVEFVCEAVNGSNTDLSATIGVYVDGKRFNSRTVKLKSTAPSVNLKVGTLVSVRVISGTVSVESKGKVVKVDPSTGIVTVAITETGAQLSGTLAADGSVEVKA